MRDPIPLCLAREPLELETARQLLVEAGIVHSVRVPFASIESLMGGAGAPATICVARADVEHARAVLAEAWGAPPEVLED